MIKKTLNSRSDTCSWGHCKTSYYCLCIECIHTGTCFENGYQLYKMGHGNQAMYYSFQ